MITMLCRIAGLEKEHRINQYVLTDSNFAVIPTFYYFIYLFIYIKLLLHGGVDKSGSDATIYYLITRRQLGVGQRPE